MSELNFVHTNTKPLPLCSQYNSAIRIIVGLECIFIFLPDILGIKKKWEHNKKHDDTFNDDDEWCDVCDVMRVNYLVLLYKNALVLVCCDLTVENAETHRVLDGGDWSDYDNAFYCLHACRQIKIKHTYI